MRVLVLTDRYPPHYAGGYEIACHAVAERLLQRGDQLLVLTSTYGVGRPIVEGHVHRVLHRSQDSPSLLELAGWDNYDNRVLSNLLRSWKPDIVYAWSLLQLFPSLYLTLKALDVPVVFNIQDLWLPTQLRLFEGLRHAWLGNGTGPLKRVAKPVARTLMKLRNPHWLHPVEVADVDLSHLIFCSDFQRHRHMEDGLPVGDHTVIYNGVDLDRFSTPSPPTHGGTLRMAFASRLVHEKGAHVAIEAMNQLVTKGCRCVTLSIAGISTYPWEYTRELHRLIDDYNLADFVRFCGEVRNKDIGDFYRRHDVLVFPSTHREGLPVTVLEAMACGLPVLGTTVGGTAEILKDGLNGLAFSAEKAEELAARVIELLETPGLVEKLGSAAREFVADNFDIERICDQTQEYLRSVVLN